MIVKYALALVAALALSAPAIAADDISASTIPAIGSSIIAAIRAQGIPTAVVSNDTGHLWSWEGPGGAVMRAITDDDGTIRMIDVRKDGESVAVNVKPVLHILLGQTTLTQIDNALHSDADYTAPGWLPDHSAKAEVLSFRTSRMRELVLFFNAAGRAVQELVYGERGMVARAGLLPGASDATQMLVYHAPVLRKGGVVEYPHTSASGTTILKLAIDKHGAVSEVTLFVSSGDPALDDAAKKAAMKEVYTPAQLAGKPVDAIVFRDERFIVRKR